jgi:hypothetical protein
MGDRGRSVIRGATATIGMVTVTQVPELSLVVAGLAVLIFCGVVLPAVFLQGPERRRDARAVLKLLFDFLRPSR